MEAAAALPTGVALALVSSALTAVAHALLKGGGDRLAVRGVVGLTCTAWGLPACLLAPLPSPGLAPWLIASTALHTVYTLVLIRSYGANDFVVAYPISRGIAPLAAAVLGIALLGDAARPLALLGVAAITMGVLSLAVGANVSREGVAAAVGAGLLTTAYTVVDAHGMRLAPVALTFLAWFFALDGLVMVPIVAFARRGATVQLMRREGWHGVLAGSVSVVSFGSALLALRFAPVGVVSALRETSVVVGVIIAGVMLKERVGARRICAAVVIAGGALLIVASG